MLDLQIVLASKLAPVFITLIVTSFISYYRGDARKLRRIPTVGSNHPLLSYRDCFKFLGDAKNTINIGVEKWNHKIFKIPELLNWNIVVSDPTSIEEVRKAPDNALSAVDAINQILQAEYTLGPTHVHDQYHVGIVKAQLTRSIPQLVPDLFEELGVAFKDCLPVANDWTKVKAVDTFMSIITRTSNRVFVGVPLCRDPEWLRIGTTFAMDVGKTAFFLRMFPKVLRPLVNTFISPVEDRRRRALKLLAPVIAARRREREKGGNYEKPLEFLTWLMDVAKGYEATDHGLMLRILSLNFATIHTTSMTFGHVIFNLASHPEYVEILREEAEEVVGREGWTKEALDQMFKVDSFIKESQRVTPNGLLLAERLVKKDYTFSNGTTVPAGSRISISTQAAQCDPDVYVDPFTFDGLRFVKMRQEAIANGTPDKKFDVVTINGNSLPFGLGRHACPGRFFATSQLKLMLAYLVMNYDVKLEQERVRPPNKYVYTACLPNHSAEILLRKRQ